MYNYMEKENQGERERSTERDIERKKERSKDRWVTMQKMTRKLEIHKASQTQTNCEVQRDDSSLK